MPEPPLTPNTGKPETDWGHRSLPHFHADEAGILRRCYHSCRNLLTNWQFWLGMTLGFPLEHLIWEKLWPFSLVTKAFGL